MKTAAAVVIVLALAGLFGKGKKKHQPPPTSSRPPIVQKFDCGDPGSIQVDEASKQRIIQFGKQLYRNPIVTDEVLNEVAHYIVVYSTSYCIEPELAASLIARESGFNPRAVSSTGAKGLGQLIDSTAREMGCTDSFDIQQNLRGSIGYFNRMLKKWQGNPNQIDLALASYLQGPRTVQNNGGKVPESAKRYVREIFEYRQKMLSR